MALSSINYKQHLPGGLHHNDRSTVTPDYLLPPERRLPNLVWQNADEAQKMINELHDEAIANYRKHFGQKLQSKTYLWEAVINFNENHTLEDMKHAVKEIENDTGFTAVQIAMHNDEGHVNSRNVTIYNRHAHVVFFTLDRQTGQQLFRKKLTDRQKRTQPDLRPMDRARLMQHQDIIADALKMKRGKRGSGATRTRMGHKQYREHARELATLNELKEQYKKERDALKASKTALQTDYQNLKKRFEILKKDAKEKRLTISEMRKAFMGIQETNEKRIEELQSAAAAAPSPFDLDLDIALAAAAAEKRKREEAEAREEAEKKRREEAEARAEKAEARAEAAQQREKAVRARYDVILQEKNDEIETLKVKIAQLESNLKRARKQLENAATTMQEHQSHRKVESLEDRIKQRLKEKEKLEKAGAVPAIIDEETVLDYEHQEALGAGKKELSEAVDIIVKTATTNDNRKVHIEDTPDQSNAFDENEDEPIDIFSLDDDDNCPLV